MGVNWNKMQRVKVAFVDLKVFSIELKDCMNKLHTFTDGEIIDVYNETDTFYLDCVEHLIHSDYAIIEVLKI